MATDKLMNSSQGDDIISALEGIATAIPSINTTTEIPSSQVTAMTGYAKSTSATPGAITTSDTLNEAVGKLEKKVDNNTTSIGSLDNASVGLGNVTNNAQVKAISGTVTNGGIVTFGADGSTVADSAKTIETSLSDDNSKIPTSKAVRDNVADVAKLSTYSAGAGTTFKTVSATDTITDAIENVQNNALYNKNNILSTCCVGTCTTVGNTAAKVVTISGDWTLRTGVIIGIKFTYTNSASNVTLNVNGSGDKQIYFGSDVYTGSSAQVTGYAAEYIFYQYDGTYWVWLTRGIFSDPQKMAQAEATAGTETRGRLISAKVLSDTIDEKLVPVENNILLGIENNGKSKNKLDISNISTLSENTDANHVWNGNVCTVRGAITFTINSDNSITVSGNNTTNYSCVLTLAQNTQLTATDRLSGCPAGGATSGGYILAAYNNNDTAIGLDIGNGDTISQTATMGYVRISVAKNVNIGTKTFYPMIISNDMYSAGFTDYQPYSLPNTAITPALIECVDNGSKNKLDFANMGSPTASHVTYTKTNTDITCTSNGAWAYILLPFSLNSGAYNLSFTVSNYSKSGGAIRVTLYTDSSATSAVHTIELTGNGNYNFDFAWTGGALYLGIYVNQNGTSYANTVTLSKVMICTQAEYKASQTYQPYAMSNVELTEKLVPTDYTALTPSNSNITSLSGGYFKIGKVVFVSARISINSEQGGSLFYGLPTVKNASGITTGQATASVTALAVTNGISDTNLIISNDSSTTIIGVAGSHSVISAGTYVISGFYLST